jgi:hypothetical protein
MPCPAGLHERTRATGLEKRRRSLANPLLGALILGVLRLIAISYLVGACTHKHLPR